MRIVYAFAAAAHRGSTGSEHLAAMFVPLYLWRASAFMAHTAREDAATLQARLDRGLSDVSAAEARARQQLVS